MGLFHEKTLFPCYQKRRLRKKKSNRYLRPDKKEGELLQRFADGFRRTILGFFVGERKKGDCPTAEDGKLEKAASIPGGWFWWATVHHDTENESEVDGATKFAPGKELCGKRSASLRCKKASKGERG